MPVSWSSMPPVPPVSRQANRQLMRKPWICRSGVVALPSSLGGILASVLKPLHDEAGIARASVVVRMSPPSGNWAIPCLTAFSTTAG